MNKTKSNWSTVYKNVPVTVRNKTNSSKLAQQNAKISTLTLPPNSTIISITNFLTNNDHHHS